MKTVKLLIVLLVAVILGLTMGIARAQSAKDYLERGIKAGKKGQYDQNIADLTKTLELNPSNADAYFNRGAAYLAIDQLDQAIADNTKALELNPRNAEAYFNRGAAYLH